MLHGRYRITEQLGSGAFGTVLKAEDTALPGRLVAIKRVETQTDIRQEMAILAQLDHPHIPHVSDFFQEHGCCYLVMKYIAGKTLAEIIDTRQTLPISEVLSIGLVLCDVLTYLHNQSPSIIFRDLKPENVIQAHDGHLWMIDFGIARHFKPGQAKDTYAIGSVGYAPPEQHNRAQTDARTDIYALGALLYYLATGDDPSTHPFQFRYASVQHSLLRTVIERCTQLNSFSRYASAQDVASALRGCQQSLVVVSTSSIDPVKTVPGRSILWIYAQEDVKVVKSLETHLAMTRRRYGLTFLHNKQECRPGEVIKQYWMNAIRSSLFVGVIHSPYFWGNDDLVSLWESLVYPTAKAYSRVLPFIGRECGDPYTLFKEVITPRSGNPLHGSGDLEYARAASEVDQLCASTFGLIV